MYKRPKQALASKVSALVRTHLARRKISCLVLPRNLLLFLAGTLAIFVANPALAFPATAAVCDQAARQAASESGVPLSVLWSITRTETGRFQNGKLQPWPWTVNMEGTGHWFETETAARAFVFRQYDRGARSFDIGCFQINHKWHGASFRSIEHMFDPLENARYAAAFLLRLHRESGDWSVAAGAYHSRTPEYASRYRARFESIRKRLKIAPVDQSDDLGHQPKFTSKERKSRQNNYPLLVHSGSTRSHGSLVPLTRGETRALFTIPGISEGS